MDTDLLPLLRHLPSLPLPSGLDQFQITQAQRVWGNYPIYGLGLVFHASPGATLAGEQRGWEAAMPTWVMMDEMDEEVDKDKMMKHQVNLGERGATGGHVAVSVVPHTDSHTKSHPTPTLAWGQWHIWKGVDVYACVCREVRMGVDWVWILNTGRGQRAYIIYPFASAHLSIIGTVTNSNKAILKGFLSERRTKLLGCRMAGWKDLLNL